MEALEAEKMKLMARIQEFLTPKINDGNYSAEERRLYEQEREAASSRIAEIEKEIAVLTAQESMKAEVVESAFQLIVGGKDITEGMADEQKEFIALLYDDIAEKVSTPLKRELQDRDDAIKGLKAIIDEEKSLNERLTLEIDEVSNENSRLENLLAQFVLKDSKTDEEHGKLLLEIDDITQKRDNAVAQLEEAQKEIERLNSQIVELQTKKETEERAKQESKTIQSSERAERLQELAKKWIKVEAVGALYTAVQADDGTKDVVRNSELARLDIVDSFQLPTIQGFDEIELDGAAENVDLPELVQLGSGNPGESDSSQESEAQADPNQANTQEAQGGQEDRKAFEARLAKLELAVFGSTQAA